VPPVKYELGCYIPEDGILHSHRRENLKYYTVLTSLVWYLRCKVSTVRYEHGYISQTTTFFIVNAVKT
jgi:hypothetical protein